MQNIRAALLDAERPVLLSIKLTIHVTCLARYDLVPTFAAIVYSGPVHAAVHRNTSHIRRAFRAEPRLKSKLLCCRDYKRVVCGSLVHNNVSRLAALMDH